MKWYKAEFEDDNFEMILADSDMDALDQAYSFEEENGEMLFNLFEVDDDYNNIRTIF